MGTTFRKAFERIRRFYERDQIDSKFGAIVCQHDGSEPMCNKCASFYNP